MSATPRPEPPRLARRLLEAALPPGPRTDALIGDLHEEFERRATRAPFVARLRYWGDASGITWRYLWTARKRIDVEIGMDRWRMNLRYAVRTLARSPFFTTVAVLSLALGIGANSAIFSLVDAVVLADPPYEDPESLVDVYVEMDGFTHSPLSHPDARDLATDAGDVFSAVGGSQLALLPVDVEGGVEMVPAEGVTGSYFPMTGVRAAVGRLLGPQDHVAEGAHPVVVLGHGYWQRRYGGDPGVIGREISLAGRGYTIVGVAQEEYSGQLRGLVPDLFFPVLMYAELGQGSGMLDGRGNRGFFTKARLAQGATLEQAQAVLDRLAGEYRSLHPAAWGVVRGFRLVRTADVITNPMVDGVLVAALGLVGGVVGLVLLIACANLASFLLARATDRRKEIAVRLALGAGRRGLVGQLLTETTLLSLLGGGAGLGLATWSLQALLGADLPLPVPITLDLALDGRVVGFTLGVSLLAGTLFGLAPALQSTRTDLSSTLRDESTGGGGGRGSALRSALVVTQVGVCVVLLTGAGLLLRSLNASSRIDPGFGDAPAGLLSVHLPNTRFSDEEAQVVLDELSARIARIPGVEAVGRTGNLHLNTMNTTYARVEVEGVAPPEGREYHQVDATRIDEGFLDAAGVELLEGRGFDRSDEAGGERVVLVNEAFARRFFDGGAALGRVVRVYGEEARVIGVVETVKTRQLGEAPRPFVYQTARQDFDSFVTLVARTRAQEAVTARRMVEEARALDPQIMITESSTMTRHLAIMLLPRRLGALVVGAFAALALALASIGLYGLVSYAVARRAREVGIRLSLGADAGRVVWLLAGGGMRLVALGAVLGLALSALLSGFLSRLLYGVPPLDPVTFLGVPLVLGAAAFLASWLPARRVTRVDPVQALRSD